jgi:hypothetical protein
MRIKILLALFTLISFQSCISQNEKKEKNLEKSKLIIDIKKEFTSAEYLLLYKFDSTNNCDQSKAVSIVKNNRISICFDYVKKIEDSNVKKILNLLHSKSTYGKEDAPCFDTDYALIAIKEENIIGYINISLSCNKLISNPIIEERIIETKEGLRKVGFSIQGKNDLKKFLGIN